jgi:hypothetical protein
MCMTRPATPSGSFATFCFAMARRCGCGPGPADYEDIRAFYEQLSPQSTYFRFHGNGRADIAARAAVESSGIGRVSLIARHAGRVIAACSYQGLREPGVAEIALAVADSSGAGSERECSSSWRRSGLGRSAGYAASTRRCRRSTV